MSSLGGIARYISLIVLAAGLLHLSGCQKAGPVNSAHGKVDDENGPLAEGLITFVPRSGTPGAKISAPVANGAYQIDSSRGLQKGSYTVQVMGVPPGVKAMMKQQPIPHEKSDYREIAAKYNTLSDLVADVKEGENEFNYTVAHQ